MAGCIAKSNPSRLGGGLPGGQPKGGLLGGGGGSSGGSGMVGGGERGSDRLVLRKAFGRFMVIDAAPDDSFGNETEGALFQGAAMWSAGQQGGKGKGACWRCFDPRYDCPPGQVTKCNANSGAPGSARCDKDNWLPDNPDWPAPSSPPSAACAANPTACAGRRDFPNCPPGCCFNPSGFNPSHINGVFTDDDEDYVDLDGDGYADATPTTCAKDVYKIPLTPFRQAFNAGDSQGTINNSVLAELYAPNQVNGIGSGQLMYGRAGGAHKGGKAAYTGNPRYVYDSSDYIRFKKLQAKNRNYNDKSFGGSNNGAYVPLMRLRH